MERMQTPQQPCGLPVKARSQRETDLEAGIAFLGKFCAADIKQKKYQFHRSSCPVKLTNPERNGEFFVRKGRSTSGSVRWQCKECKKITNVMPNNVSRLRYNQKKSGLMLELLHKIVRNCSVTEICDTLQINPKTYYHKLKLLAGQLEQMKDQAEREHFPELIQTELSLDCRLQIREVQNRRSALVISVDPATGYVYRADYRGSMKDTREFWNQILPAHFYLIRNQTGAGRVRMVPGSDQEGILRALERTAWSFRTGEEESAGETLSACLAPRLESAADKYIPYYLGIYMYVYNFAPEFLGGAAMDGPSPGTLYGFGNRDLQCKLEEA